MGIHNKRMSLLPRPIVMLINRWARDEETALRQMTDRKTAAGRLAGFSRSEKVEAKFILFAFAPFSLVLIAKQFGAPNTLLTLGLLISAVCAGAVLAFCFAVLWRAFRRSLHRKN